ncbi:hypothetical protein PBY51_024497 [Eleginops maclovinus]|uniref:Uncharacterized protein n=1 Tax=Eleginops maclovinus TaxID=56733 RepID=A0AAN7Y1G6_ELEMC|nr:hypothetical protein PBY51_024497 [Eleginops maclovinus]
MPSRTVPTLPAASACLTFAKPATLPTAPLSLLPPFPALPSSSSSSPRACGLNSCGQAGCSVCGKHPPHMEYYTDPTWPWLAGWVTVCLFPNPTNALFDPSTTTYVPTPHPTPSHHP